MKPPVIGSVSFFVPGVPVSQGSKRHVGQGRMIESSRKLAPWRALVAARAEVAMQERKLYDEPLWLAARFTFWRPKGHYRTGKLSDQLKAGAGSHVGTYPDIEKLLRAVNDAMEGIVFRNDSLVARVFAEKVYGDTLGAFISLGPIAEPIPDRLLEASGYDPHHASAVVRMLGSAVH